MAFRKRTYGRKKQFRRKRSAPIKRAVRKAKTSLFNKRVLRAVSRKAETKVINWRMPTTSVVPITTGTSTVGYVVSPSNETYDGINAISISQGTAQGERIGNKIAPTRVTLKGVVRPTYQWSSTNDNTGPMYVVLWVVSLAKHLEDTQSTLNSVIDNSFFQAGSVSLGMTGQLIDLTQNVNTAHVTVHNKRVMKLGYAQYLSSFGTNMPNNLAQGYSNNDFALSKMFSMTLKMPKSITFNDNATNATSMRRWYFFAVPYRVDGQLFASNQKPLIMDFAVDFKFKDM